jgi:phage FluMu protein Com
MSPNAVAVRLHRGKLTLRRLLETDFRDEARALGLVEGEPDGWVETRIWCPHCGKRRLLGRFGRSEGTSALATRCPECDLFTDTYSTNAHFSAAREIIGGVKTFRPALSRLAAWTNAVYRRWLPERRMPCANCGAWMPLAMHYPMDERPAIRGMRGIYGRCPACGVVASQTFGSFVLCLPEGQRFAREHPRIYMLPVREMESGGVPALAVTYESVADGARFAVVSARDTYRVLSINGEPVRG